MPRFEKLGLTVQTGQWPQILEGSGTMQALMVWGDDLYVWKAGTNGFIYNTVTGEFLSGQTFPHLGNGVVTSSPDYGPINLITRSYQYSYKIDLSTMTNEANYPFGGDYGFQFYKPGDSDNFYGVQFSSPTVTIRKHTFSTQTTTTVASLNLPSSLRMKGIAYIGNNEVLIFSMQDRATSTKGQTWNIYKGNLATSTITTVESGKELSRRFMPVERLLSVELLGDCTCYPVGNDVFLIGNTKSNGQSAYWIRYNTKTRELDMVATQYYPATASSTTVSVASKTSVYDMQTYSSGHIDIRMTSFFNTKNY